MVGADKSMFFVDLILFVVLLLVVPSVDDSFIPLPPCPVSLVSFYCCAPCSLLFSKPFVVLLSSARYVYLPAGGQANQGEVQDARVAQCDMYVCVYELKTLKRGELRGYVQSPHWQRSRVGWWRTHGSVDLTHRNKKKRDISFMLSADSTSV